LEHVAGVVVEERGGERRDRRDRSAAAPRARREVRRVAEQVPGRVVRVAREHVLNRFPMTADARSYDTVLSVNVARSTLTVSSGASDSVERSPSCAGHITSRPWRGSALVLVRVNSAVRLSTRSTPSTRNTCAMRSATWTWVPKG